jgi:hypothetical protein
MKVYILKSIDNRFSWEQMLAIYETYESAEKQRQKECMNTCDDESEWAYVIEEHEVIS